MQVKWGLRLFVRDLIIVIVAFLLAYHYYIELINNPYIQRIFFQ